MLVVYRYILRFILLLILIGGFYYYNLSTTNNILKVGCVWVVLILSINIINLDFTLGYYTNYKEKIGVKGDRGPKGVRGIRFSC
jgi:hypothetical protein